MIKTKKSKSVYQENKKLIRIISNILQKTDRTLLNNKNLMVINTEKCVGYTIREKEIGIDFEDIRKRTKKNKRLFLGVTKGVNIHEVGHNHITDYINEDYRKIEKEILEYRKFKKFREILGILEDCRVENHEVKLYPITIKYLKNSFNVLILEQLINDIETIDKLSSLKIILRFVGTDYLKEPEYKEIYEKVYKIFLKFYKSDSKVIEGLVKNFVDTSTSKKKRLDICLKILEYATEPEDEPDGEDGEDGEPEPKKEPEAEDGEPINREPTNPSPDGEDGEDDGEDGEPKGDKPKKPTHKKAKDKSKTKEDLKKEIEKILYDIKEKMKEIKEDTEEKIKKDKEIEKDVKNIEKELRRYNETDELKRGINEFIAEINKIKSEKPTIILRELKRGKLSIKDYIKKWGDKI